MSRTRAWLGGLLLAAVTVTICVVLMEVVLRVAAPPSHFYVYHPSNVRVFYPSEALTPGISGPSHFTTNSLGLRAPEIGQERHRLLVMGGSTAACTTLDDSEAWPEVVRRRVNELAKDPNYLWVGSSAIDGKASRHHLMHAIYLLPELPKMDHVLVYAGLNDVGHWLYNETLDVDELDRPQFWDDTVAESFRLSRYHASDAKWFRKTELYRYVSLARAAITTRLGDDYRQHAQIVQDDQLQWMKNAQTVRQGALISIVATPKMETLPLALRQYGRTLERTIDEIKKNGAQPIMMTQAIQWQNLDEDEKKRLWMGAMDGGKAYASEEQMEKFVSLFNQKMLEVAKAKGVPALDLPPLLESQRKIFFDGCHFNERGSQIVAEVVANYLARDIYGVITSSVAQNLSAN